MIHKDRIMKNLFEPIPESVFIHPMATVIGKVKIGECSSIWPGAVIRADMNEIKIGKYVNIQDNSVIHVDFTNSVEIGDYSLIGHSAILHGCKIGKGVMIGIRSIILDEAIIGDGAMITANCTIRGKTKIPPFSLVTEVEGKLKIYPEKAKTLYTIIGSLEYYELSLQYKQKELKLNNEAEKLKLKAEKILKELFPEKS